MSNSYKQQFYYTGHKYPVQVDCEFTVDATNGAGVTGLTGAMVKNVWMHTSTTPSTGNPNPANGYAIINFQDNFRNYYFGGCQMQSPLSGAEISISGGSVLTIGAVYVITTVGTSTTANWVAAGLPAGITPAVGVPFVSAITGGGTGTGKVKINAVGGAGISVVDVVGNPDVSTNGSGAVIAGVSNPSYMILRFLAPSFAGSSLATHAHDLLIKGGQAASTTNDVAVYTATLGKEAATDATVLGSASATLGGVLANSAGTPAGTVSFLATAPASGTIVRPSFVFSNSSIMVNGS